jgi:hypothetical protein
MKKMIMILAMVFAISSSYAFTGEEAVNKQVLTHFKSDFSAAQDAAWTVGSNYYKVSFNLGEQKLFAFYSLEGEYLGASRYISSTQLPINLQTSLKKNYSSYWISDLFEMASNTSNGYFVTLETADATVVLKSTDGSDWMVYKKIRKA